jgi:hypothetical protein
MTQKPVIPEKGVFCAAKCEPFIRNPAFSYRANRPKRDSVSRANPSWPLAAKSKALARNDGDWVGDLMIDDHDLVWKIYFETRRHPQLSPLAGESWWGIWNTGGRHKKSRPEYLLFKIYLERLTPQRLQLLPSFAMGQSRGLWLKHRDQQIQSQQQQRYRHGGSRRA